MSGEVSALATDEAAGLPDESDDQTQGEESVPKHGRSDQVNDDLKECQVEATEDHRDSPCRELGIEADGGKRGVWLTPLTNLTGCNIESPPGLGTASTADTSAVRQKKKTTFLLWFPKHSVMKDVGSLVRVRMQ